MKTSLLLAILLCLAAAVTNAQNVLTADTVYTSTDNGKTLQPATASSFTYFDDCKRYKVVVTSTTNPNTHQWTPTVQQIYDYYPNNSLHQLTIQAYNSTTKTYLNLARTTYTYTATNAIATETQEEWDGAKWYSLSSDSYTYNAAAQTTKLISQIRSDSLNMLVNNSETINSYDANGNLTNTEELTWDATTSAWIPKVRSVSTYMLIIT